MLRIALDSSTIASAGHRYDVLHIEFRSGRLYEYRGVPRTVFTELVNAASAGAYFNAHIRDRYETNEIL